MQLFADETDDELVVLGVEAMAREPHVMREIALAVGAPDDRVLAKDRCLVSALELRERAAPYRCEIPSCP